jgi:hypothetical protein
MTAITTPDRSLAQRRGALLIANEIRSRRAQFKRDLKAGRASLPTALMDPPDWLSTGKVIDLLLACPKIGPVKTNQILAACRISPAKTVGGITDRQRAELVRHLARVDGRGQGAPLRGSKGSSADAQHMRALADANDARFARAALKREIALGARTVASVLADVPSCVETMTIADLLRAQERWGGFRASRLLRGVNISESRRIQRLTERQRNLLIYTLAPDA